MSEAGNVTPPAVPVRLRRPHNQPASIMPTVGPLIDRFGRVHNDLRISLTDRCNLRCLYCLPDDDVSFLPRKELLSAEEIVRIGRVARTLGVETLRLTGGEPLVRKGAVEIVRELAALGFLDLALTTNGTLFSDLASRLAHAGLTRVNISCDSLRPERFAAIRRRAELKTVLSAMDAAEAVGLLPVKVNVVLVAGTNDDEVLDFAAFARETGRVVRFIEFMPLDALGSWQRQRVVPSEWVIETIDATWPLEPLSNPGDPAPATRFRFADGKGEIGTIASVTQPFCGDCNRLRLTADGAVRNCLFSDNERSLRDAMREGVDDATLETIIRACVWDKLPGHGINDPDFLRPRRSMSMIGG